MAPAEELPFDKPVEVHKFGALLFDMDGTIIDSTDAIVKHWHKIGAELGVDPNVILATSHGRRSIDVLELYDPSKANWEYISGIEAVIPRDYGHDATEVPGARALLNQLETAGAPWAIVTSGTRLLVDGWLSVMRLARPRVLVTAEDVQRGKPDPACYRLGRERLLAATSPPSGAEKEAADEREGEEEGTDGGEAARDARHATLVLEDAPAGVRAGKAAGFAVVALATTHAAQELRDAGADWVVRDMRSVALRAWDAGVGVVEVEIAGALSSGA